MTPNEKAVRAEAIRVAPGLVAHRLRNDQDAASKVIRDYLVTAVTGLHVTPCDAWMLLAMALAAISCDLTGMLAQATGDAPERIAERHALVAASWMSETHGVGGF